MSLYDKLGGNEKSKMLGWYVLWQVAHRDTPLELLDSGRFEVEAKTKSIAEFTAVAHLRQKYPNDTHRVIIVTIGQREL